MSDDLKNVYKGAGAIDRYYDGQTPIDLLRGKKVGGHGELMQPTLVGWYQKKGRRDPDVLIRDSKGATPQYLDADLDQLAVESKELELTAEILRNADQYIVKGCRTVKGNHRGISVFDKRNPMLRNFEWYLIPAGTKLHDALAITRDDTKLSKLDPIHYTVAPKDDMPLSLFLQCLKGVGDQAKLLKD